MQNPIRTAGNSKNRQKHEQNSNSVGTSNTDIQIPRVNACESRPQLSKSANLAKSSRHSSKKQSVSTSKSKKTDKTRESWKGGRTDGQTDRGVFWDARPVSSLCACVRACKQARQNNFPSWGGLAPFSPPKPPMIKCSMMEGSGAQ